MKSETAWSQVRKLLCVRLDNIGDVLMTTPALRALKETWPACHLALLTSESGAAAGKLLPQLDEVIVYDAPWLKATAPRSNSQPEYAMADWLRRQDFDAMIIFTVFSQNPAPAAFLGCLADIKLRLAYCHENLYQLLTDWLPDPDGGLSIRHEVRRQLDLVAAIGAHPTDERLGVAIGPAARTKARQLLQDLGVNLARPWVVVHPGATAPSRRYPPTSFAEVARRLSRDWGWQVLFSGSPYEDSLIDEIRHGMGDAPSYSLAGRLSLEEMAALLEIAPLLISNNSGPVHLAAATGTPVVDLYALTNPQHTPWQVPSRVLSHDVPCKYCYKSVCPLGHNNCLHLVTPDEVVQAALELFEETSSLRK